MLQVVALIVAVIVICWLICMPRQPTLLPGQSTSDGSFVYVGTADTPEAARSLASVIPGAKSFVWYANNAGQYARMVYAVRRRRVVLPSGTEYTLQALPVPKKEGFDTKVVMRLPKGGAGESFTSRSVRGSFDGIKTTSTIPLLNPNWETFSNGDITRGTNWVNAMDRSVLPS